MKKIIFRADGNSKSGLGHLYRAFALIEILKSDFDCLLLTASGSTLTVIPESYAVCTLPATVGVEEEAIWLSANYPSDRYMVIADGYQFDSLYQKRLKELNYTVVYVDDLAAGHMYADLIINHSPGVKLQNYSCEPYTKFATGTEYALVRPLFIAAAKARPVMTEKGTAFVCFGGSDQFNFTGMVCKILLKIPAIKKINVVTGGAFNNTEIQDLQKTHAQLSVFKNLSERELLSIMQQSGLAIVPTSTILFEVCCVKMPVLTGYYVHNQEAAYFSFLKENAVLGIGNFKNATAPDIEQKILALLEADNQEMLEQQARLFDGKQKQRFISILTNL